MKLFWNNSTIFWHRGTMALMALMALSANFLPPDAQAAFIQKSRSDKPRLNVFSKRKSGH